MDLDRTATAKASERPSSRWRREHENAALSARLQSKTERPTSRRGTKEDSLEYGNLYSTTAASAARNAVSRPTSASTLANRMSTGAVRLATMASATGLGRLNTAFSISGRMTGLERPATQHGIAAARPATTRGPAITRQVQDKRYYEGLLQLKMRQLSQEIATILRDIEAQNRDRATILHYDKRAKDLAAELTTLQGELADYNIVMDKMTSNVEKESIEQEATELASKNERVTAEIERMFERRRQMEQHLRATEKEIETERQRTEKIIENMDESTRERYEQLYRQKMTLQSSIDSLQRELDSLSKEQGSLEEQIALSPLKQEAVKLNLRIVEAKEKREKLREEEKKRLSPEMEREQLLQRIKQDNMDIAAAEAQVTEKKKRMSEVERELEQLETDLEDNHSEKQSKYKELRKREEMIEQFMSSFDENKAEEIKKMERLEKSIVEYLEMMSSGIDGNIRSIASDESSIFTKTQLEDYEHVHSDPSFETLSKDYVKLLQTFRKFEILQQKLRSEADELKERIDKRQSELITLEDLDGLKARSEMKHEDVTAERKNLMNEQSVCAEKLKNVQQEYDEVKERLSKNRIYLEIETLEKKLESLQQENKRSQEFIKQQKQRTDYTLPKQHALELMEQYGRILKENLKFVS